MLSRAAEKQRRAKNRADMATSSGLVKNTWRLSDHVQPHMWQRKEISSSRVVNKVAGCMMDVLKPCAFAIPKQDVIEQVLKKFDASDEQIRDALSHLTQARKIVSVQDLVFLL